MKTLSFKRGVSLVRRCTVLPVAAGLMLVIIFSGRNVLAQKSMVKDINTIRSGMAVSPSNSRKWAPQFILKQNRRRCGLELWKSDGTEAGTERVKDICAGAGSSFTDGENFVVMNNTLYFPGGRVSSVGGQYEFTFIR